MVIVLLGPPGSGKGTQAEALVKRYGFSHLSTGQLLRDAISSNSATGQKAKEYMDSGNLVPDSIVTELVESFLKSHRNVLLDGFPRNLAQAVTLDSWLSKNGLALDFVILLDVRSETLIKRMLLRARKDDEPTTIANRLDVFKVATQPLVDYYKKQEKLKSVNGDLTVGEVEKAIQDIVEEVCV